MERIINIGGRTYRQTEAISDFALEHFQEPYTEPISKEEVFFFIYGVLHSEEYRSRWKHNLDKELPRIPRIKGYENFVYFRDAGYRLGFLHTQYEQIKPYPVQIDGGNEYLQNLQDEDFRVEKMKFGKTDGKTDKTVIVYNQKITIRDIPLSAYEYIVNGKSAIEWVMERQAVTTHKDSGIENDANDWAIETMGDAKYPFNLLLSVITVSLETLDIVKALPKLDIYKDAIERKLRQKEIFS